MELLIRPFDALTLRELYEILKARSAVFVVEQNCPYLDPDGMDPLSLHFFYKDEEERIIACLRMYPEPGKPGTLHAGRVLTTRRGEGWGGRLLHGAVAYARSLPKMDQIYIEAQTYAAPFYAREGFQVIGEEFLEDGIPHVPMLLQLR